jgi:hypothetical protein
VTTEFLARISNAPKTRNASIAFHPPIRHNSNVIELHNQTSDALAKGCSCRGAAARRENKHATS